MTEIFLTNLLSPIVLAFVLGIIAKLLRSELAVPKDVYLGISLYLLLAIGLEGGVQLARAPFAEFVWPALAALLIGAVTPCITYLVMRRIGRFSVADSAAVAAHYGSVSAVTFIAAQTFFAMMQERHPGLPPLEGYMPTLLTLLESPGIHIALLIGALGTAAGGRRTRDVLHEVLTGRTMMLLVGGLIIGTLMGQKNWSSIEGFFHTKGPIFRGLLCIFLLEMGILAASRLADLRKVGLFLLGFGICMPVVHGTLGVLFGAAAGLTVGGCTVLAAMAASASYIAAPPAVRITLPEANPAYYLTAALAITFPFNILFGIPLYFEIARFVAG